MSMWTTPSKPPQPGWWLTVSFSDHSPLGIDLFREQPRQHPQRAKELRPSPGDGDDNDLFDALVRWYRINEDGTYAIKLWSNQPVGYQVYLDTDLSRPWPQIRKEVHPDFGEKFVLPDAPTSSW